jgi:hypothetical protein
VVGPLFEEPSGFDPSGLIESGADPFYYRAAQAW